VLFINERTPPPSVPPFAVVELSKPLEALLIQVLVSLATNVPMLGISSKKVSPHPKNPTNVEILGMAELLQIEVIRVEKRSLRMISVQNECTVVCN